MSLEQFKEAITVAGEVVDKKFTAYRMDNQDNDMRAAAGLGACHCCDYFLPINETVVFIEETQLSGTVKAIRAEFSYLDDGEKIDEIVNEKIKNEHQLKAYGAMLVLYRLAVNCATVKKLVHGKKFEFWLIASRIDTPDKEMDFDHRRDNLKTKLDGFIGGALMSGVSVLSAEDLKIRLSNHAPTP